MNRQFLFIFAVPLLFLLFIWSNSMVAQPNIVKAEYFIDNDPGFGLAVNIHPLAPATHLNELSFSANVNNIEVGLHQLFVRVQNANGKWSISNRTLFYKAANAGAVPHILKAEYFFDQEPAGGFGSGTNIPVVAGTAILGQNFSAATENLSTGLHNLFIRVKDANGLWSTASRTLFYKAPALGDLPNIVQAEYFIDSDPGFGNGIPIAFSSMAVVPAIPIKANVTGLTDGIHKFYLRVKDIHGKWSISNISNFSVLGPPLPPYITVTSIDKKVLCAGDSLNLGYHATGAYGNDNVFTAWLSNGSGSFASEQLIGQVSATGSGLIGCNLPAHITSGTGYRIRVKSSNTTVVGDANGVAITIQKPSLGADVTGSYCGGDTYDLTQHFTDIALTYMYFNQAFEAVNTPAAALAGMYQVIGNNSVGCTDTAQVTITELPKPHLGADTAVYHVCAGESTNLQLLYNTASLTAVWNTGNPTSAIPGIYHLYVNNLQGCKDTAIATVILSTAQWTGAISSDWHTAGNWNTNKVPDEKTHVIVSISTPNICIIGSANAAAASVQVKNGATVRNTNARQLLINGKCAILPSQ